MKYSERKISQCILPSKKCNGVGIHNHLICKQILNHLGKLGRSKEFLEVQAIIEWSSRSQMFFKIGVLKRSSIVTGKHLCSSLLLIKERNFIKKRLQCRRFSVTIEKFLRLYSIFIIVLIIWQFFFMNGIKMQQFVVLVIILLVISYYLLVISYVCYISFLLQQ